mgnify:FL=1
MKKTPEDIRLLEQKIQELKSREAAARKDKPESEFAYASKVGFRIGVELISGVLVGAAMGFVLDRLLETRPWLLILFMFFGGAAGVLNVYRFAKSEDRKRKEF